MKTKKLNKKLIFNKATITDLENKEMKKVNGGEIRISEDPLTELPHVCCIQPDPSDDPRCW